MNTNQALTDKLLKLTHQFQVDSHQKQHGEIRLNTSLQRHLGIDSLGRAEFFQRIEKEFKVSVPDSLLAKADTLQDILTFLQQSQGQQSQQPAYQQYAHLNLADRPHLDLSAAQTLLDLPLRYAEKAGDKAHIYFQREDGSEEIITYNKLLLQSLRVAHSLKSLGLKEGETVAIMQPTDPAFFYCFFGVLYAGGIPVPIYPPFRAHMLEAYAKVEARILKNAQVRILITFDQAEKLSLLLKTHVPSLKHVTTPQQLLKADSLQHGFQSNAEQFAFIQYTSGSTNDPKGVLLTHANLLANIRAYGKAIAVNAQDVTVSWLPLYHDLGLIGMWLGSLYFGTPLILMTPFSFLNHPEKWLWAIHYHQGSISGAPNFAYELCVRKVEPQMIEGLDLSSWRIAANGAEKIYPRTLEAFNKKFAPYGFKKRALLPVYGLAESTVGLAISPIDRDYRVDQIDRHAFEVEGKAIASTSANTLGFVSCGKALIGHSIRITNELNEVLPEREVGRLQFRGPSNMQGYFNRPEATAAVYYDGWIDSGDLGYIAEEEIFITGRQKDLIIKSGRNIYPLEIEELVGTVKGVRQGCVAAFGVSDNLSGTEKIIVVAETREKDQNKLKHIQAEAQSLVATNLDLPIDQVILVKPHTVPKTSSGKLQRSACKSMYLAGKLDKYHRPPWMQVVNLVVSSGINKIKEMSEKIIKFIYTVYVGLIVCVTLPVVFVLVCVAPTKIAATIIKKWSWMIFAFAFCPIKIINQRNLNVEQPLIYVANHTSYLDTLLLIGILPINTKFVGKKELLKNPFFKFLIKKLGHLTVDRFDFQTGVKDTEVIVQTLQAGNSIMLFPEGTFGFAAGLRPFRLGAFKISAETNVSICPIAIAGMRNLLRDQQWLLRPVPIILTALPQQFSKGTEWQSITELRNNVRMEIAKNCGEPSLDFIVAQTIAEQPKGS